MRLLFISLVFIFCISEQNYVFSQSVNVTFQVDMNQFSEPFNYGNVYLNSSFDLWCGGCRPMSDNNNDGIWTVTIPLVPDTYEYKFTLDGWTDQEWFEDGEICTSAIDGFINRSISVTDENVVLPIVCYSNCTSCIVPVTGCTYETAINFNEIATEDDLSCEFEIADDSGCESDLNNDGVVSTSDLLLFLISFNQIC